MLQRILMLAALAATLAAAGTVAHARTGQSAAAPEGLAGVKLLTCDRDAHDASFQGRMWRVRGAERMSMRFTLFERLPGAAFKPVSAEGLGRWRRSKPLKAGFVHRQVVRGLADAAAYRASVQFRWYTEEGDTVRRERHRSRICDQSRPLPNLRARIIGAEPAGATLLRYSIRVVNRGRVPADAVVRLSVDGAVAGTRTVPAVLPGEPRVIVLQGPRCQRQVEAFADPADTLEESDEQDNGHTVPCATLAP
jgi:hypothetical protein